MKYVITLLFILAGFVPFTEAQEIAVSTVPFDFVVGKKTFPAGTYEVSQASGTVGGSLLIRSTDGQTAALFNSRIEGSATQGDSAKLLFRKQDGKYFLAEIVGAEDTYALTLAPNVHPRRTVDPDATITVSTP